MLIKTIAYKFASSDLAWITIPVQTDSAIYRESTSAVRQGTLIDVACVAYVVDISMSKDALYQKLSSLGALFLLVTHTGDKYYLGTDTLKASFTSEKLDGDKPGSKSGYNIKIALKSMPDALFKSFDTASEEGNIVAPE
jgi:hypothetical protein